MRALSSEPRILQEEEESPSEWGQHLATGIGEGKSGWKQTRALSPIRFLRKPRILSNESASAMLN